jgi:hypothetical protein
MRRPAAPLAAQMNEQRETLRHALRAQPAFRSIDLA